MSNAIPDWIDRHSVSCYFCARLFDERDGYPADEYNAHNGGSICPDCIKEKEGGQPNGTKDQQ